MPDPLSLPPTVTVGPTSVGVSVLTADGTTVEVRLRRLRGLSAVPPEEMSARARELALGALAAAARSLAH